jgi:SAM-dependent methyltransferase
LNELLIAVAPVRDEIPRFVDDVDYTASFGEQWLQYRRVQLDSQTGKAISRERLLNGTRWNLDELPGELVLELGCGAGRFTEVLLATGATVVAVDASAAVDACRETCGDNPSLTLVQADVYDLPFRPGSFDRVFCYGVLQHTPDPERAFRALVEQVRPGGRIAVDLYTQPEYVDRWSSKRAWRPLTRRLPRSWLRAFIEWYMPFWLPVDNRLRTVPRVGRFLTAIVPCWNPRGLYDLTYEEELAWTILDTFDALASRYDQPQSRDDLLRWCSSCGLTDVDVHKGGNGLELNARRLA